MRMARGLMLVSMFSLAACSGDGHLRHYINNSNGPEEFGIVPTKPLEMPADMTALPVPTPGATNRVDPTPQADAVVALGGKASALQASGVPSSDSALVTYAGRDGVDPAIRAKLAAADAKFRKHEARWSGLNPFGIDRYYEAYKKYSLDADAVAEKYRKLGYPTPSYPPE